MTPQTKSDLLSKGMNLYLRPEQMLAWLLASLSITGRLRSCWQKLGYAPSNNMRFFGKCSILTCFTSSQIIWSPTEISPSPPCVLLLLLSWLNGRGGVGKLLARLQIFHVLERKRVGFPYLEMLKHPYRILVKLLNWFESLDEGLLFPSICIIFQTSCTSTKITLMRNTFCRWCIFGSQ